MPLSARFCGGRGPGTTTPSRDCFLRLLLLTLLLFASSFLPSPPTLEQPPCAPGSLPPPQASLPGPAKVPRFSQRLQTSPGSIQRALPWKDGCCVSFPVCGTFLFLWFSRSFEGRHRTFCTREGLCHYRSGLMYYEELPFVE